MADRLNYRPPDAQAFRPLLRNVPGMPPLDPEKLQAALLQGEERKVLQTPTTGDATLALSYKRREGAVASMGLTEQDLEILQLQGARQEGFRVNTGLRVVAFFAGEIEKIATDPENGLARVTMPPLAVIKGFADATEEALAKYQELAARLGMQFSQEEEHYIKDYQ